jgi:hypothetical protein
MTREEPTEISIREIDRALQQGINAADPDRASALGVLARLEEAREATLRREYQRLSKVLPPGDPRLEGLILRMEASQALRREAGFEVERSQTGVPAPDQAAWTLYGFVRGADPGFLEDKIVALYDARGARISEGETTIEKDGRFLLRYKAPAERAGPPELFLYLTDARQRAVHKDPRGLRPQIGRVAYLEIDLHPETKPSPGPSRPREEPTPPPRPSPEERRPPRGQPSAATEQPGAGRRTPRRAARRTPPPSDQASGRGPPG